MLHTLSWAPAAGRVRERVTTPAYADTCIYSNRAGCENNMRHTRVISARYLRWRYFHNANERDY